MLGRKERWQLEQFITGSLRELLPDDHVLVRIDQVLDLAWLRGDVANLYCADNGRPCIDPEVAVRLMLPGFLLGFMHDRRLMREAQVNLAIRWFIGYDLHESLPDHSSLTRIRQALAQQSDTVHRRLDAASAVIAAPASPDGPAEPNDAHATTCIRHRARADIRSRSVPA